MCCAEVVKVAEAVVHGSVAGSQLAEYEGAALDEGPWLLKKLLSYLVQFVSDDVVVAQ